MKTTRIDFIGPSNGRANGTRSRAAVPVPKSDAGGRAGQKDAHSDRRGRTRDGGRPA